MMNRSAKQKYYRAGSQCYDSCRMLTTASVDSTRAQFVWGTTTAIFGASTGISQMLFQAQVRNLAASCVRPTAAEREPNGAGDTDSHIRSDALGSTTWPHEAGLQRTKLIIHACDDWLAAHVGPCRAHLLLLAL